MDKLFGGHHKKEGEEGYVPTSETPGQQYDATTQEGAHEKKGLFGLGGHHKTHVCI